MIEIDKIFVIHVKEGLGTRREHIIAELGRFDLNFEFVLNDDVTDLTEQRVRSYFSESHCLKKEEVSCSLKHYSVLERIKRDGHRVTLVFEDDVFLEKNFSTVLGRVLTEAEGLNPGWIVSLGNAGNQYVKSSRIRKRQSLYTANVGRATDSYLIDHNAALRRLDYLTKNKTELPAGHMMNHVDKAVNNKMYWCHPTVVEQGSQNGFMRSMVSRNKKYHRVHWLIRDFKKKHIMGFFN